MARKGFLSAVTCTCLLLLALNGIEAIWIKKMYPSLLTSALYRSKAPQYMGSSGGSAGASSVNFVGLLKSEALADLLDEVDVGQLVLGEGFKGILATIIESPESPIPAFLQPSAKKIKAEIPYIISNYYDCGGETQSFFAALHSVLDNPLLEPFLSNSSLLEDTLGDQELLAAALPVLYSSVVLDNAPMYDWLKALPVQCITQKGYVQPAAVKLTEGSRYELIASEISSLVNDYYNTGCSTEQMLSFFPVVLEALDLPPAQQANVLFQKKGTTPGGVEVGLTSTSAELPSILQCITPSLPVLVNYFAIG